MSTANDILVLAGRRDGVALGDALGASVLRLGSALPEPERDVRGPFDAALVRGWRGVICAAHAFDVASAARVSVLWPNLPLASAPAARWPADDSWKPVHSVAEAVAQMPMGLRVFAATGRESEPALAAYKGDVILRQNTTHSAPPSAPNITYNFTAGAFDAQSETALFQRLGIEALLLRNIGGTRGFGKVEAGQSLGLRVYMLEPPCPVGDVITGLDAAHAWIQSL